ncbi:hypothetical protein QNA24_12265 [Rhodococcus qingshengii]|uniref:DUF7620 family protein n=1 Tax=Rhodococcus qingshengii TaxID=334542 RepID=UPI0024B9EF7C|nr:hypothetical protein [Rhodococcus qingshengii]MDJ0487134.1 hypothetical protein [Rhodococcus qingshengii]
MTWWWKQRRDAQRGCEEAEQALKEVKSRDPLIAELGRKHRLMLQINGFGEDVEQAMGRKKGHA